MERNTRSSNQICLSLVFTDTSHHRRRRCTSSFISVAQFNVFTCTTSSLRPTHTHTHTARTREIEEKGALTLCLCGLIYTKNPHTTHIYTPSHSRVNRLSHKDTSIAPSSLPPTSPTQRNGSKFLVMVAWTCVLFLLLVAYGTHLYSQTHTHTIVFASFFPVKGRTQSMAVKRDRVQ